MYALIDCNNFFVSCERVFRPELAEHPVAVLSNNDGCIISRSQEVKDLNIAMGVPLFQVKRIVKDNDIKLFSANFELYGDMSQRIVSLLREITPLIEVYSIDECFLDLSQLEINNYSEWARKVKNQIWDEIGIPVSIGVGVTKTLAKVASTYSKKHGGVYVIDDDIDREAMLDILPVEDIWGIGWRTAPKLKDRGISYAGQLIAAPDAWLEQLFNISGMRTIRELRGEVCLAFGDKQETRKMIMRSRSFGHQVRAYHQLESAVATFAAQVAMKLRSQNSLAKQMVVFMSTGKHVPGQKRVSTLVSFSEPTSDTVKLIQGALEGLERIYDPDFAYKKAGVTAVELVSVDAWQLSLLEAFERRDETFTLMQSIDALNKRYGNVIYHAVEKPKDANWHSNRKLQSPHYTTSWAELPKLRIK